MSDVEHVVLFFFRNYLHLLLRNLRRGRIRRISWAGSRRCVFSCLRLVVATFFLFVCFFFGCVIVVFFVLLCFPRVHGWPIVETEAEWIHEIESQKMMMMLMLMLMMYTDRDCGCDGGGRVFCSVLWSCSVVGRTERNCEH